MLPRLRAWRPAPRTLRRSFIGALVTNTAIVVTGGAVRLTASGLGCPTFPRCTDDSLVATRELGVHGAIEFGNRLLTFVLAASVLAALALAWRARRRDLARPAALLLLGIVVQAALGGVTVLTELHPVTVMAHFLVSMVLIAIAALAVERAARGQATAVPESVPPPLQLLARLLTVAVAATLVLGTVVTGTGPHSGDTEVDNRLPLDLEAVSQLHADAVFLVLGLTLGLLLGARGAVAGRLTRRTTVLLAVLLGQGLIGFWQYATDLPVLLVGAHMLGAALVWIAAVRVLLAAGHRRDGAAGALSVASAGNHPEPAVAAPR